MNDVWYKVRSSRWQLYLLYVVVRSSSDTGFQESGDNMHHANMHHAQRGILSLEDSQVYLCVRISRKISMMHNSCMFYEHIIYYNMFNQGVCI